MSAVQDHSPLDPIPPVEVVRVRLTDVLREARLLRAQLRLAERAALERERRRQAEGVRDAG